MKIVLGLESILNACVHMLSRVRLFVTPWTLAHQAVCPWDSPGKNTGVGCHFFLQGIFPTQGLNPLLLRVWHCQVDSLPLYHLGRTSILNKSQQILCSQEAEGREIALCDGQG